MPVLDSHQHYWDTSRFFRYHDYPPFLGVVTYGWKQAGLLALDRNFLPPDLGPERAAIGATQTIVLNVLNNVGETEWLLDLASAEASIAGVVGWVDLTQPADQVAGEVERLRLRSKLRGFRHLVEFEADDNWLLRPDVVASLRVLESLAIPYDLLLRPRHLTCVPSLSEKLPDLNMVVDHVAKPDIRGHVLEPWQTDLRRAAVNPRVLCKLSGMVTEADVDHWCQNDLLSYVEAAVDAFGVERVMFGSDWPVCTLAGSYGQVHAALHGALAQVLGGLSPQAEQAIFHDNAARFYKLHQPS